MSGKHKLRFFAIGYKGETLDISELMRRLPLDEKWYLEEWNEKEKKKPDICIVFSSMRRPSDIFRYTLRLRRRKIGYDCFLLWVSGEVLEFDIQCGPDHFISFRPDGPNNYFIAPCVTQVNHDPNKLIKVRQSVTKVKTDFCNFIFGSSYPHRVRFLKMLSSYKRVDCAGKSMNNTDRLQKLEEKIGKSYLNKPGFMSTYKFSIAFENRIYPGYISEKILHAFEARTIPIYYGTPEVKDYFNPAAFINVNDYENYEQVIERVKQIDQDPELFDKYMEASPIQKDSKWYEHTKEKFTQKMDVLLEKVIDKRGRDIKVRNNRTSGHTYSVPQWLDFLLRYKQLAVVSLLLYIFYLPRIAIHTSVFLYKRIEIFCITKKWR